MEWMKGLVMALISGHSVSQHLNNDLFSREARLMSGSASPSTPAGSQITVHANANDIYVESQIKPTFQQVHQNLSQTLVRLIDDVKRESATTPVLDKSRGVSQKFFASPDQHSNPYSINSSITDRIMTLSASNHVAELQLLMTVISAKYM